MVESLIKRRERLGLTYVLIREAHLDGAATVAKRLAGW